MEWGKHYGPSGRYVENYDFHAIKTSRVHDALLQIGRTLPSTQKMKELRKNATISCGNSSRNFNCNIHQGCLFNIQQDPCELRNVAQDYPQLVKRMEREIKKLGKTAMKPNNVPFDPKADPKYWGYVWTNWKDFEEI